MKLIIKSKPEHFYRAGMKFTRQPVEVDVDADTATVLINEPMLIVEGRKTEGSRSQGVKGPSEPFESSNPRILEPLNKKKRK